MRGSHHVFKEVDLSLVLDVQLGQLVVEVGPHGGIGAARERPLLQRQRSKFKGGYYVVGGTLCVLIMPFPEGSSGTV